MVLPKKSVSKSNTGKDNKSPTRSSSRVSSSRSSSSTSASTSSINLKSISKSRSSSRPTSRTSVKSKDSVVSVGIGVPANAGATAGILSALEYTLRFRLMPEGPGLSAYHQKNARLMDCIVFIITCERHDTVALTSITTRRPYCWWPFVPLQDAFAWSRNGRDGLMTILSSSKGGDASQGSAEGEAEDVPIEPTLPQLPEHTATWAEVVRIQLPKSNKCVNRLTRLVKLTGSADCCKEALTNNNSISYGSHNPIRWVKRSEIVNQTKGALWGGEVLSACRRTFNKPPRHYISEVNHQNCFSGELKAVVSPLLQQLGWTIDDHVQELYNIFLEHMYPALEMSDLAFRSFVRKNKLLSESVENKLISQLFRTLASLAGNATEHLNFGKLLTGLAVMDPKASTQSLARARFILRFYDSGNKKESSLNLNDLTKLIADLEPDSSATEHKSKAVALLKNDSHLLPSRKHLETAAFIECSKTSLSGADGILRWNQSYFTGKKKLQEKTYSKNNLSKSSSKSTSTSSNASSNIRKSSISSEKSKGSKKKSKSSSKRKTLCSFHQSKSSTAFRFHYSCHAVTVDGSRRSGDARIICDDWVRQWKASEMSRHRYSLENVFRDNSTANVFYTLVRDKESKLGENSGEKKNRGLLSPDTNNDLDTLLHYIELLCFQVKAVLSHEPKLLRLAGPVHVIGDIRGSLADLFALEQTLFPAVPTISQTVLFLGNYSDSSTDCQTWGTECVFYLMALKLLMPNKIYMLRGRYEMKAFNLAHLTKELVEKYGKVMGEKIVELMQGVFDCLPLAATIEESIICTHSGIPQLPSGKTLLDVLASKEMDQLVAITDPLEKVAPVAYEIITNMPTNYANSPEYYIEGKQIFHPSFVKDKKENCSYFNGEAFSDFMRANKFELFVRSHNPCKAGYAMTFDRRCLTLFSSHLYHAGRLPWTSALQVDPLAGKFRILLLEHKSKGGHSRNKKSS